MLRTAGERLNDYDAVPYAGYAFPETHPAHLAAIGRLFGLAAPDPRRARVLELGCAAGDNLIPLAFYRPEGSCLGVELSPVQAELGRRRIAALGLGNIRIVRADIMELGDDIGEFDYILAHGVWSWVPGAVRDQILSLCVRRLAPHGIAYVSYNTLPGWRRRGTLRDLALYAARGAATPGERLASASRFFTGLAQDLAAAGTEAAGWLKEEIARVQRSHPSYLYHELLAEVNEPMLFTDFMAGAAAHGLQYLGDAEVRTMFGSFLGPEVEQRLEAMTDTIGQEQYLDIVRNRAFRATLLCHAGRTLEREIDLDRFRAFAFHAGLEPAEPPVYDRRCDQVWSAGEDLKVVVTQPLTKAALCHLAEVYPDSAGLEELARAAHALLPKGTPVARVETLLEELAGLYVRAAVGLDPAPSNWRAAPGERPAVNRLARRQAAEGEALVGPRHTSLRLDPWLARLAVLLDGTRTVPEAAEQLARENPDEAALPGARRSRAETVALLNENGRQLVEKLNRQGLLAPPV